MTGDSATSATRSPNCSTTLSSAGARTIGVSQTGCLGLMTAVSIARAMLIAHPSSIRQVICVGVDRLPTGSSREILYNVISDGACAVLVASGDGPNRVISERQVTKGYYWDCEARRNEIVAAYFPTARYIIQEALSEAGLTPDEVACIIPHNVSRRSWEILLRLTSLPFDKLYAENIADKGHVISGDNFINLKDAASRGPPALRRPPAALQLRVWSQLVVPAPGTLMSFAGQPSSDGLTLVTGGTGTIGAPLLESLAVGRETVVSLARGPHHGRSTRRARPVWRHSPG